MEGILEFVAIVALTVQLPRDTGAALDIPVADIPSHLGQTICEIEIGVLDVAWQQNLTESVVDVIWGYDKFGCNDQASCFGINSTVSQLVQVKPVHIQEGVKLRFLTGNMSVPWNMKVFKVSEPGFQSCQTMYATPVNDQATSDPIIVDESILTHGQNLFIAITDNELLRCQLGLRLNVTVKPNKCHAFGREEILCSDHGECMSSSTDSFFTCRCCHGYSGNFCKEHDGCFENDCSAGSRCVDVMQGFEGNDYQCICPNGKRGFYCDIEVNECNSNPCVHGICQDESGRYQCYCLPGYTGINCEMQYNECVSSPCLNGGQCFDKLNSYQCHCLSGYFGIHCEMKIDFCASNPCHNATFCIDQGTTFKCICEDGFTGTDCSVNIDECISTPCKNSGTCHDLVAGYHCQCTEEFTGPECKEIVEIPPTGGPDLNQYFIGIGLLASALGASFGLIAICGCWVQKARGPRKIQPFGYFDDEDRFLYDVSSINIPRPSVHAIYEATSSCYQPDAKEPLVHSLSSQKI